jgi:hypothetical protein
MNLRTVTIWTTGLMLIGTVVLPFMWLDLTWDDVVFFSVFWFFNGSPLVVSFVVVIMLRHNTSAAILLVSTIVYGLWYVSAWYGILDANEITFVGFVILCFASGLLDFSVMIPVWTIVIKLDRRYTKKATIPTQPATAK